MRGVAEQAGAFDQSLVHEREMAVFEIAQTAVDQLRGRAAGAGREVAALDQGNAPAARGRIQRHAGAGDAAADDAQIEGSFRERLDLAFHDPFPDDGKPIIP